MNVSEIRQRIFDQMDYFPDLQQYRDSVVRRINDRYQELCDSAHWLFLQKEDTITVRKEELGSSAKSIGIAVTSANPRLATASGWTPLLQMEGQTLTNTDSGAEFKIIRVNGNSIFLGGDWDGTKGSVIYDWKITFQRFLLPEDCIEVLGYVDRAADRGKLLFIGRRREEFAYLDADNTGDPSTVVEDEHVLDDPPTTVLKGSTVATSAASNYLEQGTTYEYRYTIYREGRESPPSLVTSVLTPSVGNVDVLLENFEDTGWYSTAASVTSLNTGMEKLIYRRDKTNDGKWMLISSISSITTSFTTQGSNCRQRCSGIASPVSHYIGVPHLAGYVSADAGCSSVSAI